MMKLTIISDIAISLDVVNQLNDHLEKGIPFIVYDDKEHYMRCYPMQRRIRTYTGGECAGEEQFDSTENFVARLQTGLLVYKNFFSLEDEAPKVHQVNSGVKLIEEPAADNIEYEEDKL